MKAAAEFWYVFVVPKGKDFIRFRFHVFTLEVDFDGAVLGLYKSGHYSTYIDLTIAIYRSRYGVFLQLYEY